ncbi:MAG TPA: hypothetical protein VM491_23615 [Burkholderiaceae bacterium]|jgi:hypothetical protein|nr:hypothetical protein [Burkholderiaceae bacterium]
MPLLRDLISDVHVLLELHPSELAGYILEVLTDPHLFTSERHRGNFAISVFHQYQSSGVEGRRIAQACAC